SKIKEIAARLGYEIEIEEHHPARIGDRIGDYLNGPDWAFAWTVHVRPFEGYLIESEFLAVAEIGDRIGVRLRGWGALDLECVIKRAAPAHTTVIFAYEVEPVPDFWIDFTS
ncbi:putative phage tail protein, partial [Novosphingobium naphthalenivorans]|uniref:putative phage tail protein n=1 Tax=Novosphingobium naphthalenivorans TaxID=273168 RepID=UPI000A84384D